MNREIRAWVGGKTFKIWKDMLNKWTEEKVKTDKKGMDKHKDKDKNKGNKTKINNEYDERYCKPVRVGPGLFEQLHTPNKPFLPLTVSDEYFNGSYGGELKPEAVVDFEKLDYDYEVLPEGVKLYESNIEGKGIFTTVAREAMEFIGISHVPNNSGYFHNNLIRTPLGGFINHSPTPNCRLNWNEIGQHYYVETIIKIKPDEELTLNYRNSPCINKCQNETS